MRDITMERQGLGAVLSTYRKEVLGLEDPM
mgnify:CR=1 FL=1